MTIKKISACGLLFVCSLHAIEENDLKEEKINEETQSESTFEANSLVNKNNWNTRKWGSIYFLFPHLSFVNLNNNDKSCVGNIVPSSGKLINFFLSGVVEYKYMFHRKLGINVRLNLNNQDGFFGKEEFLSTFSFDCSLEWIYARKGKHIFSGSFSPIGLGLMQDLKTCDFVDKMYTKMWTWGFMLLKYEYDRRFYLNFGKIKANWVFSMEKLLVIPFTILFNVFSLEFGLNIIGVNDWRKKKMKNKKKNERKKENLDV